MHILNTEDYVQPILPLVKRVKSCITIDTRYIGNISPALLKTTLLDGRLADFNRSPADYYGLASMVSMRICPFDATKARNVSMYGPEITGHMNTRATSTTPFDWFNRVRHQRIPEDSPFPEFHESHYGSDVDREPNSETQTESDTTDRVENWLGDVPSNPLSPIAPGTQDDSVPTPALLIPIESDGSSSRTLPGVNEATHCLLSGPIPSNEQPPADTQGHEDTSQTTTAPSTAPTTQQHLAANNTPSSSGVPDVNSPNFPGPMPEWDNGVVDQLSHTNGIMWYVERDLPIPQAFFENNQNEAQNANGLPTGGYYQGYQWIPGPAKSSNVAKTEPEVAEEGLQATDEPQVPSNGMSTVPTVQKPEAEPSIRKIMGQKAAMKGNTSKVPSMSNSSGFVWEMNNAITNLVAKARYLKGNVSLRTEFGRILMGDMDESGIAFNAEGTNSHGWTIDSLKAHLTDFRGSKSFTKILTTEARGVEHMTEIRGGDDHRPLWYCDDDNCVTYSFYCSAENYDARFIVDVKVDGDSCTYNLRDVNEDQPPVWVHDVLRN